MQNNLFEKYLVGKKGRDEIASIVNYDDFINSNTLLISEFCKDNNFKYISSLQILEQNYKIIFIDLSDNIKQELSRKNAILIEDKISNNSILAITNPLTKIQDLLSIEFSEIIFVTKSIVERYYSIALANTVNTKKFTENQAIDLLKETLTDALSQGISDVFLYPLKKGYRIDFEQNGRKTTYKTIDDTVASSLIGVIGVKAKIKSQGLVPILDGKFNLEIHNIIREFRVSAVRSLYSKGYDFTIRIPDKFDKSLKLEDLGFTPTVLAFIRRHYKKNKIFVFSAPMGQGKTTAVYTLLLERERNEKKKAFTIEDPIEFNMEGYFHQIQINNDGKGDYFLDYHKAINKGATRAKAHIIFIGEIRDVASAKGAVTASQIGSSVFTTLHTYDSSKIPSRLFGFGKEQVNEIDIIENLGVGVCLKLIKNIQLCKECRIYDDVNSVYLKKDSENSTDCCLNCHSTGYKGSILLTDYSIFNENVDSIHDKNYINKVGTYASSLKEHLQIGNICLDDYKKIKKKLFDEMV